MTRANVDFPFAKLPLCALRTTIPLAKRRGAAFRGAERSITLIRYRIETVNRGRFLERRGSMLDLRPRKQRNQTAGKMGETAGCGARGCCATRALIAAMDSRADS